MHFEVLTEDVSGQIMLETLIPKIIDTDVHTYKVRGYKGCGSLPPNLKTSQDPSKRALLNQLPKLLAGYGKQRNMELTVIVVCDLDKREKNTFLEELKSVLKKCNPSPQTSFCLAIEEGEAWLLGDWSAIKSAYPNAKEQIFKEYKNDVICGTWEKLADIVFIGGHKSLKKKGQQAVGKAKSEWASSICPKMDVNINKSPSFNSFKKTILSYVDK